MITDVMPFVERYGLKYPKTKYKVKKIDTDKKCNNDKKEKANEKGSLGNGFYIA